MTSAPSTVGHVAWFGDASCGDRATAGGKGAALSRMAAAGLPVPPGFVLCASAFARFLSETGARDEVARLLAATDADDHAGVNAVSAAIRERLVAAPLPEEIARQITAAYAGLCVETVAAPVAIRSSAIAEDSETASFAGQQDTFLNVSGPDAVSARVRDCWVSLFGSHALVYRSRKGSLTDTGMAVVVQRMVDPEKSGVLFTADPVARRRDHFVVEATWGLGEAVVSGLVIPDNYSLDGEGGRLLRALVPPKTVAVVRDLERSGTKEIHLDGAKSTARVLTDDELAELHQLGVTVAAFFGKPQDIEWAIEAGRLYLLQSRPITTL